jgi:hypothetical protein
VPLSGLPSDALTFVNVPLSCHSNVIPVVRSSVQEAEYAGLFSAARLADEERRICTTWAIPSPRRSSSATISVRWDWPPRR